MKLTSAFLIGLSSAWEESEYEDTQFNCSDDGNGGTFCKWIKCRYFPKMKKTNVAIAADELPTKYIECPNWADAGCDPQWGMTYQVGKSASKLYQIGSNNHPNDKVPPNGMKHSKKTGKLTITCLNSGATSKAFCKPKYGATKITYEWKNGSPPECAGPGQAWAEWSNWSGVNTRDCVRSTATRSRQCNDGAHPGTPTQCVTNPEGRDTETKIYWPKSCGKCHADLGMMYTPGKLNLPKLNVPNVLQDHVEDKFDDGFIPVGQTVVKAKCYNDDAYTKPYGQKCKCDNDGCRIGDAPLCQGVDYKGYGTDYFWAPGAKDTFKERDDETTVINPDFSLSYADESLDNRFRNRVTWWDDGPSICRYWNKYAYVPGIERPITTQNGNISWNYFNWMECDTYVGQWPPVPRVTTSNGAKYYEVLTTDTNVQWIRASNFRDDQHIEDSMVITGTYTGEEGNNDNPPRERVFHGLCRTTQCTVDTDLGGECHEKVVNQQSQQMFQNMPKYPGLLFWNGNQWKCQNLLVTARTTQATDYNEFEILVKVA